MTESKNVGIPKTALVTRGFVRYASRAEFGLSLEAPRDGAQILRSAHLA